MTQTYLLSTRAERTPSALRTASQVSAASDRPGTCYPAVLLMLSLLPLLHAIGCSAGGVRYPVRPDVARETLTAVLSHWKAGGRPEELRASNPEIVVQDFDWAGGAGLSDYSLTDSGSALDANLSIQVRLELVYPDGRTETRNVWYLVGTDPVLTVFRDLLHP